MHRVGPWIDSGANGWQWNADYTAIHLCGAICDQVSSNPNGSVSITVGCDTIVR